MSISDVHVVAIVVVIVAAIVSAHPIHIVVVIVVIVSLIKTTIVVIDLPTPNKPVVMMPYQVVTSKIVVPGSSRVCVSQLFANHRSKVWMLVVLSATIVTPCRR